MGMDSARESEASMAKGQQRRLMLIFIFMIFTSSNQPSPIFGEEAGAVITKALFNTSPTPRRQE